MKRIGVTASKIAKGNIWFYHLAVVLISFLFGMFVYLICGFVIVVTIFILSFLLQKALPSMDQQHWMHALRACLKLLGILIGAGMVFAIVKNVQLKSKL